MSEITTTTKSSSRTFNFKNTKSKDNRYYLSFTPETSERVTRYCKEKNLNRQRFSEMCVNQTLDVLEREMLNAMSHDELVEMAMKLRKG